MLQESPLDQTTYCYYSTFQLFGNDLDTKLLQKQRYVKKLLLFLGEEWKAYAGRSIYFSIDSTKQYVNWQFCFDHLLITWLQEEFRIEEDMPNFLQELKETINHQQMQTDDIYLKPVCEGFYLSSVQIWEKLKMSKGASNESLPELNNKQDNVLEEQSNLGTFRIIKPLTIVTGKIMNYITGQVGQNQKQKQLITNDKDTIYQQYTQEDQLSRDISNLKLNDFTPLPNTKQKKLIKMGEKMLSQEIVQKAYSQIEHIFQQTHQKYQVVKFFVTSIVEVNQNLMKTFTNKADLVNVRFLQPATGFYNELIELWVVFSVQNHNIKFSDFLNKVKTSLGSGWNEKYLQPTLYFYNKIIELWTQILTDPQLVQTQEDQQVKILVEMLRESLLQIWESEVVLKMFNFQREALTQL